MVNPFWAGYRPTSKSGLANLAADQQKMWAHKPQKLTVAYRKWIVRATAAASTHAGWMGGRRHKVRVCAHSRLALTCLRFVLLLGLVLQMDSISDWDEWRIAGYDGLPAPFTIHESALHPIDEYDWSTKKWLNVKKANAEPDAAPVFDQDKPMEAASQDKHLAQVKSEVAKVAKTISKAAHKTNE